MQSRVQKLIRLKVIFASLSERSLRVIRIHTTPFALGERWSPTCFDSTSFFMNKVS
jgi:hypothetical protein